ncbi:MAG TPA: hypothetical protein VGU24_20740 [Microvirga sp.]|jgi:hypothetical protein|nr:hypothetical protein [Microvirga sp.]
MGASDLLVQLRTGGAVVTLTPEGRVRVDAPPGLLDETLRLSIREQRDALAELIGKIPVAEERGLGSRSFAPFASGGATPSAGEQTQKSQNTHLRTPVLAARVFSSPTQATSMLGSSLPVGWRAGVQQLAAMPVPPGFTYRRWSYGVLWAEQLIETAASVAADLGWSVEALFGLHPRAPAARYDGMGLSFLLRPGDCILSISADAALIRLRRGAEQRFTPCRMSRESVPAWHLAFALPVVMADPQGLVRTNPETRSAAA